MVTKVFPMGDLVQRRLCGEWHLAIALAHGEYLWNHCSQRVDGNTFSRFWSFQSWALADNQPGAYALAAV